VSDAKQPIYNAMNWLGSVMPCKKPDDSVLIINAYEKVYTLPDRETQQLFLDVIQRLRFRDATIENIMGAWDKSAGQLRAACQMIGDSDEVQQ
jgi:hypothetical protein